MTSITDGKDTSKWPEWSNYILLELERLNLLCSNTTAEIGDTNEKIGKEIREVKDQLSKEIADVRVEIATLKVKSGTWGAIGALVPIILAALVSIFVMSIKE